MLTLAIQELAESIKTLRQLPQPVVKPVAVIINDDGGDDRPQFIR
jgi:hypothetical protein